MKNLILLICFLYSTLYNCQSNLEFGEYIYTLNKPNAKYVNLKIKIPFWWKSNTDDQINDVVESYLDKGKYYSIIIKENVTFFSRVRSRKFLDNKSVIEELIKKTCENYVNIKIIDHSIVTINTYPTLQFKLTADIEQLGYNHNLLFKCYLIFYEDKVIQFHAVNLNKTNITEFDYITDLVVNSILFLD
jgi:hypothetical protein